MNLHGFDASLWKMFSIDFRRRAQIELFMNIWFLNFPGDDALSRLLIQFHRSRSNDERTAPTRRYNAASLEIHQRRSIQFRQLRLNCFETFSSHVVTQSNLLFPWSKKMLTQSRQIQFRFKLEWIFNEILVQTRFTSFFNYEKSR